MRDIRFRAWDKEDNKMYYGISLCSQDSGIHPNNGDWDDTCDLEDCCIMQYTGLKDKRGKELYESDIISHSAYKQNYQIEYIPDAGGYVVKSHNHTCPLTAMCQKYLEIIGNIYENPELIT